MFRQTPRITSSRPAFTSGKSYLSLSGEDSTNMKKHLLFLGILTLCFLSVNGKRKEVRSVVRLETSAGNIRIALSDETPFHRDNFLVLAGKGFYDGTLFHRVIKDFMIQGGDPESKGAPQGKELGNGEPGYRLAPEFCLPYMYHRRGAVAMAREGDDVNPERASSGSQFYIVWGQTFKDRELQKVIKGVKEATDREADFTVEMEHDYRTIGGTPHLDGQYTVFGEVIEGMDIVDSIQHVATDHLDRPLEDVIVRRAVVEQKSKKAFSTQKRRSESRK